MTVRHEVLEFVKWKEMVREDQYETWSCQVNETEILARLLPYVKIMHSCYKVYKPM
jgi:hypothetical protein